MTCQHPDENEGTHDNAVPAESLEAILSQEVDKPLHGKECHNERYNTSYGKQEEVMACSPAPAYSILADEKFEDIEPCRHRAL